MAPMGLGPRRGAALRRVLVTTAALVVVASVTAAAPAGKPRARTLVSFPGVARAFDYDSGRVAWIDSAFQLHIRTLRTNAETAIDYTSWYGEYRSLLPGHRLVLDQRRLLWLSTVGVMPDGLVDHVYAGTVNSARAHRLTTSYYLGLSNGNPVASIAGDASGFSYGIATTEETDLNSGGYELSGGVWSVVGGKAQEVADAPPAFVHARAAGRVAIVPAVIVDQSSEWASAIPGDTVEIRNATDGAVVSSFSPGTVRALTLSKQLAAVLVEDSIELYDVATGELLGSTDVPADTASELEIEGPRIIFRTNHAVKLLDAGTGRVSTLATTTPWRLSGITIDGGTVAWAESKRIASGEASRKTFVTRIRAIALRS